MEMKARRGAVTGLGREADPDARTDMEMKAQNKKASREG
jgi:hypothetical protein